MLPAFSIVIPCFNEEMRIGETLRLTLDYLAANTPEKRIDRRERWIKPMHGTVAL